MSAEDSADVVVIGAGPAGAVLSTRLAEAGISVICLEQGDWPRYGARQAGNDIPLSTLRELDGNPNRRRSPADYPVDDSDSDITAIMWNGVGGGSTAYLAQWTRSLPSDFRARTLDGVGDDWPVTYADLAPYYRRVERDFRVSGTPGDPAYPAGNAPPHPAVAIPGAGLRVARAHNELGWHWWPGSNAIDTSAGGCTNLGVCRWGCPREAKGSADRTHWPRALRLGARLRTGAHAQVIETDAAGRAEAVVYSDDTGARHRVRGAAVVLAANGIGTPRLLLNSASRAFPDGLANSSGLVGRRLMMHPFGTVVGLFDDDIGTANAAWGQLLYSLQFYETDERRGFVRGAKWGLVPTGPAQTITRSYPWGDRPVWGPAFHQEVRRRLGRSVAWGIIAEDLPDSGNRVTLSPTRTDQFGMPAPAIRYRLSANSRAILDFNLARAAESLRAAGARETIVAPLIRESGWHILGTAVMGRDPASSVTDEWGRCHDVPNLFIADGSTWPTSSGTNPTATIAALALRLADHLVVAARVPHAPGTVAR